MRRKVQARRAARVVQRGECRRWTDQLLCHAGHETVVSIRCSDRQCQVTVEALQCSL